MERICKYLNDEFVSLKHTKECFQSNIKSLEKDADNFAERAEKERSILLIIKSNSLENSVKENEKEL